MNETTPRRRNPALVMAASAALPGSGTLLAGATTAGLLILGVFLISLRALLYPPTGVGVPIVVWLFGLVDAWLRVRHARIGGGNRETW